MQKVCSEKAEDGEGMIPQPSRCSWSHTGIL